ncbi:MAG: type II secretion system F family protein [Oscillospiraceae bacterium]|nr:type II secretion system F family protein [Oscillospiraceae bacterium]
MKENAVLKKVFICVLLLLAAVISLLYLGDWAMKIDTHSHTIDSIDEKVDMVMKLTAASTVASAGITAIPGDTATPIAEKLADFTQYFLLIMCVLYAEKYSLTIIGLATFKILIPLACVFMGISLFSESALWRRLSVKFAVFGLAIFLIIPASIRVSDMIYNTFDESINNTISSAEQIADDTVELTDAGENSGLIQSILSGISETASSLTEKAANTLNRFVETLAIMIVTSCIIPLLVVIFFVWLAKIITGVNFAADLMAPGGFRRFYRRRRRDEGEPEAAE